MGVERDAEGRLAGPIGGWLLLVRPAAGDHQQHEADGWTKGWAKGWGRPRHHRGMIRNKTRFLTMSHTRPTIATLIATARHGSVSDRSTSANVNIDCTR